MSLHSFHFQILFNLKDFVVGCLFSDFAKYFDRPSSSWILDYFNLMMKNIGTSLNLIYLDSFNWCCFLDFKKCWKVVCAFQQFRARFDPQKSFTDFRYAGFKSIRTKKSQLLVLRCPASLRLKTFVTWENLKVRY